VPCRGLPRTRRRRPCRRGGTTGAGRGAGRDERGGSRGGAEQPGPLEQLTARGPVLHVQGLNRFVDYRVDLFLHLRTSMEFSLGRDTLPSQARSVRGESRRLRRERDNAKKLLSGCLLQRIAERDCTEPIMRPIFSANW